MDGIELRQIVAKLIDDIKMTEHLTKLNCLFQVLLEKNTLLEKLVNGQKVLLNTPLFVVDDNEFLQINDLSLPKIKRDRIKVKLGIANCEQAEWQTLVIRINKLQLEIQQALEEIKKKSKI